MPTTASKNRLLFIAVLVLCLCRFESVNANAFILPESGSWFNQSAGDRTGLNMEVQGRVLSGAYYGFDGNGNQVWLLFSGPLTLDSATGRYAFSGDLTRSMGGGCIIDCPAEGTGVEHSVEVVGRIDIDFLSRSQARFRTDQNDFQMIAPLIYGTSARQVFPGFPDVILPEFEGEWAFDFIFPGICGTSFSATVLQIGRQSVDTFPIQAVSAVREAVADRTLFNDRNSASAVTGSSHQQSITNFLTHKTPANSTVTTRCTPAIPSFTTNAELVCTVMSVEEVAMPVCEIRSTTPPEPDTPEFILSFSPADSSDSRIIGVVLATSNTNDGEPFAVGTFNANRLSYD